MTNKEVGPYSIGSDKLPGLSRIIEEASELLQVAGKFIGNNGGKDHWDGSDLYERVMEEIADTYAALDFFVTQNKHKLQGELLWVRRRTKFEKYLEWHSNSQG